MWSESNSFWGDVVLDIFNMAYRDEDSILDQIYQKQIFSDFYYEDSKFYKWLKNMHIWRNTDLYNKELIKIGF